MALRFLFALAAPFTLHVTEHSSPTISSSDAHDLRRRAEQLVQLARSIESSLVMSLADSMPDASPVDGRSELYEAMFHRSLHQLHRSADDLRLTALRFRTRADELEAASRVAA